MVPPGGLGAAGGSRPGLWATGCAGGGVAAGGAGYYGWKMYARQGGNSADKAMNKVGGLHPEPVALAGALVGLPRTTPPNNVVPALAFSFDSTMTQGVIDRRATDDAAAVHARNELLNAQTAHSATTSSSHHAGHDQAEESAAAAAATWWGRCKLYPGLKAPPGFKV